MNTGTNILSRSALLSCLALFFYCRGAATGVTNPRHEGSICFTENKGQVADQNNRSRPDVLFGGTSGNVGFHLRKNGISYQFNRIVSWSKSPDSIARPKEKMIERFDLYRLDLNWLNTSRDFQIKKENAVAGYSNFYLESCPDGIMNVMSYTQVTCKEIYNGIDLKWYEKDGRLKYDYIVSPGADYKQIRIEIKGAESVELTATGSLVIRTPFGEITEQAPKVLQGDKVLPSKWLLNKNILSFEIDVLDQTKTFVIDPAVVTRNWGTYYGSSQADYGLACTTDRFGNAYMAGQTISSTTTLIATSGSWQNALSGGTDAFLAKFNSAGTRLWATYYGSTSNDVGYACSADSLGAIYMAGNTATSATVLASVGAFKTTGGGSTGDGFLVKFSPAGGRIWGTYYGGTAADYGRFCATASNRFVYFGGYTASTTSISTLGSHQPALSSGNDAYLVRFDSAGTRLWGTYYGGTGAEFSYACAPDSAGNIFISGFTSSATTTNIASAGSHQSSFAAGSYDAFVAKFNTAGVRQWGTYYGGAGTDSGNSTAVDRNGNVYLSGQSNGSSGTVIATPVSHQATVTGISNFDYLVKFNASGVRQWGTYYGSGTSGGNNACVTDSLNNVYLTGESYTSTLIATSDGFQTVFAGSSDAYFAIFNSAGVRKYGTFYGGSGLDLTNSCAIGKGARFYIAGQTATPSNVGTPIASVGSHQPTYGSGTDAFLAQFNICIVPDAPVNITPPQNLEICMNNSTNLIVAGTGTVNWYAGPTSTAVLGSGQTFNTGPLSMGYYTYYVESITCNTSARTAITLTAGPVVSVGSGAICQGQSFLISPQGANSYFISDGQNNINTPQLLVSPTITTSYSVVGVSSLGCTSQTPEICIVTVNPLPTVTVNSGTICQGQAFFLNPQGANTYYLPGNAIYVSPQVTTTYSILGTSAEGCISALPGLATVTVHPLPTLVANGGAICLGQSFTITATGSPTYNIQGGSAVVSPQTHTSYNLNTTSAMGCYYSTSCLVIVNNLPSYNIYTVNNPICMGSSVELIVGGSAGTYTWNNGSHALTQNVTPITATAYTVTGTDSNGCTAAAAYTLNVLTCVGIESETLSREGINIYPNPNQGYFTVELSQPSDVLIYNTIGELLFSQHFAEKINQVGLENCAKGVYFIKLLAGDNTVTYKLIRD